MVKLKCAWGLLMQDHLSEAHLTSFSGHVHEVFSPIEANSELKKTSAHLLVPAHHYYDRLQLAGSDFASDPRHQLRLATAS